MTLSKLKERGFTLVELLIVILIIGILLAIALPTFLSQQDKAHDGAAKTALNTAYKVARFDATTHNNGRYRNADDIVDAIQKDEPELDAETIDFPEDASTGKVGVLPTTPDNAVLAIKSDSGAICTVDVVNLGAPQYDCAASTGTTGGGGPSSGGGGDEPATCAGQQTGQNSAGGYNNDIPRTTSDLALVAQMCTLSNRINACYQQTDDYTQCASEPAIDLTTGIDYSFGWYANFMQGGTFFNYGDPQVLTLLPVGTPGGLTTHEYEIQGWTGTYQWPFVLHRWPDGSYYLFCGWNPGEDPPLGICQNNTWAP